MTITSFSENVLEAIARSLAEAVTHNELSRLFNICDIKEQGGQPRWERTFWR